MVGPGNAMEDTMSDDDSTVRIRALNDALRCRRSGGRIGITSGIQALEAATVTRILAEVASFDEFNPDNDPYGEHDCATLSVDDHKIIWKIDYYDRDAKYGSEDPADPAQTTRVMTVMLAGEY